MSLSVQFNGQELNGYINVLSGFSPRKGADWDPVYESISNVSGVDYKYTTYGSKTIEVPFTMEHNIEEKYNALQAALAVTEPCELIFGNQPQKYYKAIPTGTTEMEEVSTYGKGTITFLVPDGVAHSKVLKKFDLVPLYKEGTTTIIGYKFDVKNEGNVAVPVSFHVPMASGEENGYLGLAATTGAMEFGNIEESDTGTAYKNVCLLNLQGGEAIKSAMTVGSGVMTEGFAHSGKVTVAQYNNPKTTKNAGHFLINDAEWGSTNNTAWYGACGRIPIPADTKYADQPLYNWQLNVNLAYATHQRLQQTGMIQIVVAYTENGTEKLMCDMHLIKDNWGNNNARMKFKIQGANTTNMDVKEYKYEPRSDTGITCPGNSKTIWIRKYKSKFTVCFNGQQFSYDVPANATRIPTSITIALLDLKNSKETMVFMGVKDLQFFKTNVGYQVDVPNRYAAGDVLEIHGDEGKFYVNGNQQQQDECLGTKYIKAEPNTTTEVQLNVSSWCPIKKIYDEGKTYAWIEEAWL